MKRLLTAAVGVPLALLAVFRLPGWAFFLLVALLFEWAALEFVALVRPLAPRAPWWWLLVAAPLAATALAWGLAPGVATNGFWPLALATLAALLSPVLVLFTRTPMEEAVTATALLSWGTLYFAAPIASLSRLQHHDPWVFFLLLAIVWLGDTAAYYVGTAFGRHRLAPVVSPKKSWEGAVAGFATSLAATAIWSVWQRGDLDPRLLAVGAITAVASQVGDLVESIVKRAAGVKDSGGVLPGHGGVYDRMDAMFLAAPAMLLALWIFGLEVAR